uniref:Uncharacterized protein n=1 Tax=Aquisalinus luteolus TaxID=1566827 RepID=A0A8J3ER10_9PROT|nr:hypothetical protein GCM10011355_13540 [Aquisalinus luteolus]
MLELLLATFLLLIAGLQLFNPQIRIFGSILLLVGGWFAVHGCLIWVKPVMLRNVFFALLSVAVPLILMLWHFFPTWENELVVSSGDGEVYRTTAQPGLIMLMEVIIVDGTLLVVVILNLIAIWESYREDRKVSA